MKLPVAMTIVLVALTAAGAPPPPALVKLKESAPVSFYGLPKKNILKTNPIASPKKKAKNRNVTVDLRKSPLVLLGFSDDFKCLEATYPVSKDGSEHTNGWFLVEDVLWLGGRKPPADATSEGTLFLYNPYGEKRPALFGCKEKGTTYLDFGTRMVGKDEFTLALVSGGDALYESTVSGQLVYVVDQGPLDDESTYPDRVEALIAEDPYQPGRHWDNGNHPILVASGNGGCAAFVTDFAKYCFNAGNFNQGERFVDPAEVRSGDVIQLEGHFMAVLFRTGDKLYTMEGNCNSAIRRTDSAWSLSGGKWCMGGKPAPDNFICGYHYLKEPQPMRKGKGPKKKK